eukprot:GFYU01005826.1.p2 GENE.GFYU01005826.1~~GFYU01005826.1.p2  ORF type:complete len:181 (-),score=49.68 GFYU01005826.1:534-1076(-)
MVGYLQKRNPQFVWQKRYFVLKGTLLRYYKEELDVDRGMPEKGLIDFAYVTDVAVSQYQTKKNGIEITCMGRAYKLHADSQLDRAKWLEAISKVHQTKLRTHSTSPGTTKAPLLAGGQTSKVPSAKEGSGYSTGNSMQSIALSDEESDQPPMCGFCVNITRLFRRPAPLSTTSSSGTVAI